MKKILVVVLMLVLSMTFAACGGQSGATDGGKETSEAAKKECQHNWVEVCTFPKTCSECGATEGEVKQHIWTEATCTAPKTCSECGATEGEALAHNFYLGNCTVCKAEDPKKADMIKALKDSERYVTYITLDAEQLDALIDLYRISGRTSYLVEIMETVNEMDSYYAKIYNYCSPYKDLKNLYSECTKTKPVVSSSSLSKVATYAIQSKRLKTPYDYLCKEFGITK